MVEESTSNVLSGNTDVTQHEETYISKHEFAISSFVQLSIILSIILYFIFGVSFDKIYYFITIFPCTTLTIKVLTDEKNQVGVQHLILRYWTMFALFWIFDMLIPFSHLYSILSRVVILGCFLYKAAKVNNSLFLCKQSGCWSRKMDKYNDTHSFIYSEKGPKYQTNFYKEADDELVLSQLLTSRCKPVAEKSFRNDSVMMLESESDINNNQNNKENITNTIVGFQKMDLIIKPDDWIYLRPNEPETLTLTNTTSYYILWNLKTNANSECCIIQADPSYGIITPHSVVSLKILSLYHSMLMAGDQTKKIAVDFFMYEPTITNENKVLYDPCRYVIRVGFLQ